MGATKGNQNAKGNKGGARKSAYQERADAIMLEKMFMDEMAKFLETKLNTDSIPNEVTKEK